MRTVAMYADEEDTRRDSDKNIIVSIRTTSLFEYAVRLVPRIELSDRL